MNVVEWVVPDMNRFLPAVIIAMLAGNDALEAHASHISMDMRPASRFSAGNVSVHIDVKNRGDEPAADIWVSARLGDMEASSAKPARLGAGETARLEIELGPPPLPAGEHTIIIRVHYTDLNAYPFSAVATIPVVTDASDPVPEKVEAELSSTDIRRDGRLTLKLDGRANPELPLRAELVLPEELTAQSPMRKIFLAPNGRHEAVFKIRNRSGRPGSTYRVAAVVDYLDGQRHRSLVARGFVNIATPDDVFVEGRIAWLIIAGILMALFVLIQFARPKRLSSPA